MTNLMTFQRAYEASAQLVTTLNTMLGDTLAMKNLKFDLSMRVTANAFTDSLVNQLSQLTTRQATLQNEVSSGLSVSAPSDNPEAMENTLDYQAQTPRRRNTAATFPRSRRAPLRLQRPAIHADA